MTLFRPCIDLHGGRVKQIVGGTLTDSGAKTNFISPRGADYFARMYQRDGLQGGHVIKLGPGNDPAARAALATWPKGLQLGGGVGAQNARAWLDAGASQVIVTSWLFDAGQLSFQRLRELADVVRREELVIDLSCRRRGDAWFVATDRWQTVTETAVTEDTLKTLASFCGEFLVHAADVEGKCEGIDERLVQFLGAHSPIPCTYAGGARALSDLQRVHELSRGRVDLTIGSALDLFGGSQVRYADCVAFNRRELDPARKSQTPLTES